MTGRRVLHETRAKSFDVICAGEAPWKVAMPDVSGRSPPVRLPPGGGAVNVALALARQRLRVGLATVLADDDLGRKSVQRIAASSVDVDGVVLAPPRRSFVVVDASGQASQLPWGDRDEAPFEIPAGWSSRVLLLSGLSPVVSHAAAFCKAARAARRQGALVVIDFNASLHAWAGHDPRTIRMVLREVDVARCSLADVAVLGVDLANVRASLRPGAVLVVSNAAREAVAVGPFGEVSFVPPTEISQPPHGAGDSFMAAICAELTRSGDRRETASALWDRALRRGHEAVAALR
jgi:sugar/nucleoside kinase (ribokinase family)